jgi:hypothetical protein
MLYICDIDGTLANNDHRSPYDETKVSKDLPLPTCEVIKSLLIAGHEVVFFSGRTSKCFRDTIDWLEAYVTKYPILYMRNIGDSRPDTVIKKELFDLYIPKNAQIGGVFDDRLSVIKMWESMGLFVFNCNQRLKEF